MCVYVICVYQLRFKCWFHMLFTVHCVHIYLLERVFLSDIRYSDLLQMCILLRVCMCVCVVVYVFMCVGNPVELGSIYCLLVTVFESFRHLLVLLSYFYACMYVFVCRASVCHYFTMSYAGSIMYNL